MHYPKISIITPSYNQGAYIERTILSVLNQNYPNLEYIIIDGGSTDGTVDLIKKYENKLHYWCSEKDKGTYDANNKGLSKITGEYWCVVNSDDILLPGALANIATTINNNPTEYWIAGNVMYIDAMDREIQNYSIEKPEEVCGYSFIHCSWIAHPAVFLHASIIDSIGLFHMYHAMDYEYWLRMEEKGYKPFVLKETIAGLRFHEACKSYNKVKIEEEVLGIVSDFIERNTLSKKQAAQKVLRKHQFKYAKTYLLYYVLHGKKIKAWKMVAAVLRKKPTSIADVWFWGAMKRLVLGVAKNDPLKKEFQYEIEQTNWNLLR